jgi:hypothetical protein
VDFVLRLLVITSVLLLITSEVFSLDIVSYNNLRQTPHQSDNDILNLWVDGMVDGVIASNASLEAKGRHKLFCHPVISRDLAYMVIDSRLKKIRYKNDTHVEVVFLDGLIDIYPCPLQ